MIMTTVRMKMMRTTMTVWDTDFSSLLCRFADLAEKSAVSAPDGFKLQDRMVDAEPVIEFMADFLNQHFRLALRLIVHFHMTRKSDAG